MPLAAQVRKTADHQKTRHVLVKTIAKVANSQSVREGPVTKNLDKVLESDDIVPQAYHSRRFIENHCNKYLKPQVYETVYARVAEITELLTEEETMISKAKSISNIIKVNRPYKEVHKAVLNCKPIAPEPR